MGEIRLKRVESLLREEMSRMISLGRIKDPRIAPLTLITEVNLSKDMKHAKVWVSFHGDPKLLDDGVTALNHAAGFIQSSLAKNISIRMMPRLSFVADHAIERGARISRILREVAH
jgi:ribosome-binding factor A